MTDYTERLARKHYEDFFAGVQDLEPRWDDLPADARARFASSIKAVLAELKVIVTSEFIVRANLERTDEVGGYLESDENEISERFSDVIDEVLRE